MLKYRVSGTLKLDTEVYAISEKAAGDFVLSKYNLEPECLVVVAVEELIKITNNLENSGTEGS